MIKFLLANIVLLNLFGCSLVASQAHESPGARNENDLTEILSDIKRGFLGDGGPGSRCAVSKYSTADVNATDEIVEMTDKNIFGVRIDASGNSAFFILENEANKYSVSIKMRGGKCAQFEVHPIVD